MAELVFGFHNRPNAAHEKITREFLHDIAALPLTLGGAEAYGRTRQDLEARGQRISANDLLIAATALAHDATLVTRNTGEFSRVAGLKIEDWRA